MNKALNFAQFGKINESLSISKKDVGLIGPNMDGEIKLRIPNPGITLKRIDDGENYVFEIGEKSCSVPKKFISLSTQPGYDIVSFNTNTNWFKQENNSERISDVIEEFLTSQYKSLSKSSDPIKDDVNIILDAFGIEDDVTAFNSNSPLQMDGQTQNGMEFEIEKETSEDLFKKFFLYKDIDSIHPMISIKRKGARFNCIYRTPKGNFECKHDSIDEMLNSPTDKYLMSVCIGNESEENQRNLVDHLMRLFKYHSWDKADSKAKASKNAEERKEIKKIMNILKNTISEDHIGEMYSDARSKFMGNR
jgi:hypothetical protein